MTPARTVRASAARAPRLTLRQLNRALLARQSLLVRGDQSAIGVVRSLMGLQAQVPRPPCLGLWTRLGAFHVDDLRRAMRARQVVRVTSFRATLHLMATDDYLAYRGTLQPMLTRGAASTLRGRISPEDLARYERIGREFFATTPATFDALRDALSARMPERDIRAIAYAIRCHVPLVQVPTDDRWCYPAAADFLLADTYLKRKVRLTAGSLEDLVRRYLAAFGPATPADAQAWSGLQGLRQTFEALRPSLATFQDERGRELFDLPDAPRPPGETPAPVRFIPEYDNLVLGHDDRSRVVSDQHRGRLVTKNLQVRATFLVDGVVAGTWKVERKGKTATLNVEPFERLTKKAAAELEQEAASVLAFAEPDAAARDVRFSG